MKLDPSKLSSDPAHIRQLIASTGMTQKEAAAALGVGHRTIGDWLGGKIKWSYPAQYALECLAKYGVSKK